MLHTCVRGFFMKIQFQIHLLELLMMHKFIFGFVQLLICFPWSVCVEHWFRRNKKKWLKWMPFIFFSSLFFSLNWSAEKRATATFELTQVCLNCDATNTHKKAIAAVSSGWKRVCSTETKSTSAYSALICCTT